MELDFKRFRNREVKANAIFEIREITKPTSYEFIRKYHYLGDAKFFCVQAFGLFHRSTNTLVGCATYSLPQGNVALKGWFGLDNSTKDIYELSRLCLLPQLNGSNATSYLLGGSIKQLKKQGVVRAVITLADSNRHVGSIYQVCNFKYYGLTNAKSDFYRYDGKVNPRGATKDVRGVWIPRTQKHRYCYTLDPTLTVLYPEQHYKPMKDDYLAVECCHGTGVVHDNRFGENYTCPYCCGKFELITKEDEPVKKVEERKVITYETDKMVDLAALKEKEPELFAELAADYPCENARYIYDVIAV